VYVCDGDALDVATDMKRRHRLNPLLLVSSASQTTPCIGATMGRLTQEDDMCRRTTYMLCVADPYHLDEHRHFRYPLPEWGGVYVPQCMVMRGGRGYAFLEKPMGVSVMVMMPHVNPLLERRVLFGGLGGGTEGEMCDQCLSKKMTQSMKRKITTCLDLALRKGHDSVVFSAFGCENSHTNPSRHIAMIFREVLQGYGGKFKAIVFVMRSVMEPESLLKSIVEEEVVGEVKDGSEDNLVVFSKQFGTEVLTMEELSSKL